MVANWAFRFGFRSAVGRDVIAPSPERAVTCGGPCITAGGGPAGRATGKTPAGAPKAFGAFLNGCLDGGESRDAKPCPAPGGKARNSDAGVVMAVPIPQAHTACLPLHWEIGAPQSALPAIPAPGTPPDPVDSGAAEDADPEGEGMPPAADEMAVQPAACDLTPADGPAPQAAPADSARAGSQALDAIPALAFGVRWLPPEPEVPAAQERSMPRSVPSAAPQAPKTAIGGFGTHPTEPASAPSGWQDRDPAQDARLSGSPEDGIRTARPPDGMPSASGGGKAAAPAAAPSPDGPSQAASTELTGVDTAWNGMAPSPAEHGGSPAPRETDGASPASGEPPEPAAQPVSRDVSWHLADGENRVDVRMAERAGEIRVTVHTPDRELAESLRADLPDLVGKLRQNGVQAESWRPAAAAPDAGRRGGSDASSSQEHALGGRRDGRPRQSPQQQSKNQSRWAGAWHASLDPAQETHT